jgi:hypothetical protein
MVPGAPKSAKWSQELETPVENGGISPAAAAVVARREKTPAGTRLGAAEPGCRRRRERLLDLLVGAAGFAGDADEDALVDEAVGDGGGGGGVLEELASVLEGEVGGDDGGGALVATVVGRWAGQPFSRHAPL